MKNLEKESFWKFECMECDIENITKMLWYIYEDYYSGVKEDDLFVKANYYDRLGTYLVNLHSLLSSKQAEMTEFIDAVYKEKRAMSENDSKKLEIGS